MSIFRDLYVKKVLFLHFAPSGTLPSDPPPHHRGANLRAYHSRQDTCNIRGTRSGSERERERESGTLGLDVTLSLVADNDKLPKETERRIPRGHDRLARRQQAKAGRRGVAWGKPPLSCTRRIGAPRAAHPRGPNALRVGRSNERETERAERLP